MPSPEALVDAFIQSKEGLATVFDNARNDCCAKQNAPVCAAIDAVARGKTDIWSFHEEGHLAVKQLAVFQLNMISASGNFVQ